MLAEGVAEVVEEDAEADAGVAAVAAAGFVEHCAFDSSVLHAVAEGAVAEEEAGTAAAGAPDDDDEEDEDAATLSGFSALSTATALAPSSPRAALHSTEPVVRPCISSGFTAGLRASTSSRTLRANSASSTSRRADRSAWRAGGREAKRITDKEAMCMFNHCSGHACNTQPKANNARQQVSLALRSIEGETWIVSVF